MPDASVDRPLTLSVGSTTSRSTTSRLSEARTRRSAKCTANLRRKASTLPMDSQSQPRHTVALSQKTASTIGSRRFSKPRLPQCAESSTARTRQSPCDPCRTASDHLQAANTGAYDRLGQNSVEPLDVAVRSSATAEDLPDASFAGQQETYLNVQVTPLSRYLPPLLCIALHRQGDFVSRG